MKYVRIKIWRSYEWQINPYQPSSDFRNLRGHSLVCPVRSCSNSSSNTNGVSRRKNLVSWIEGAGFAPARESPSHSQPRWLAVLRSTLDRVYVAPPPVKNRKGDRCFKCVYHLFCSSLSKPIHAMWTAFPGFFGAAIVKTVAARA